MRMPTSRRCACWITHAAPGDSARRARPSPAPAWIDGASPFRTLVSVIIPQSWPALTAVAIFHFFFAWNDFFGPLVYLAGKEELYPIAVAMTQFNNAFGTQPGMLMAATLMTISVPVVIFFLAQRQFMQGIVMTGVEK